MVVVRHDEDATRLRRVLLARGTLGTRRVVPTDEVTRERDVLAGVARALLAKDRAVGDALPKGVVAHGAGLGELLVRTLPAGHDDGGAGVFPPRPDGAVHAARKQRRDVPSLRESGAERHDIAVAPARVRHLRDESACRVQRERGPRKANGNGHDGKQQVERVPHQREALEPAADCRPRGDVGDHGDAEAEREQVGRPGALPAHEPHAGHEERDGEDDREREERDHEHDGKRDAQEPDLRALLRARDGEEPELEQPHDGSRGDQGPEAKPERALFSHADDAQRDGRDEQERGHERRCGVWGHADFLWEAGGTGTALAPHDTRAAVTRARMA